MPVIARRPRSDRICHVPVILQPRPLYSGVVIEGAQLGRALGYPTANVLVAGAPPLHGIYASYSRLEDGATWHSVSYFGRRPTVSGEIELLESHLFAFGRTIYGRRMDVQLVALLREDSQFPSVQAMTAQMTRDCMVARQALMTTHPTWP
jgi:riboflavin kinase/FMN adenylyltransferase